MTEQLEQELRLVFAEDAGRAPVSAALAQGVLRRVRHRRHAQVAWAAGAAAAMVASVAVVSGGLHGGQPVGHRLATPPIASRSPLATPPVASKAPLAIPSGIARTGPLKGGGNASCVEEYSPKRVTGRAFAFDGTIAAIGPARTNRPGVGLDLVAATFTVSHWYKGGSGSTVTVDIDHIGAGKWIEDSAPAYGIGSRLLVSGMPRWGGPALTDAIAWGCGFTRYYDKATADSWQAAFD
jgi:hypothetical protein